MNKLIAIFLCIALGCLYFAAKPPLLEEISFSRAVYDEDKNLLRLTLSSDDKYRLYTSLEEISPLFVQATLLQEDHYFFHHPGVNPFAIVKAAWQTYVLQTRQFGASTITMQTARMLYGIHSKTITGKLWQIMKAMQLELFYSKEEILEAYLNLASYGGNIEGVGAASLIYFEKPPLQLNLAEALRLSVVPQNPERRLLHRENQEDLQKGYRKLVERWIANHPDDDAMYRLMSLPAQLTKKNLPFHAPHFVESVLQAHPHPQVITTLNLNLQKVMEKITRHYPEQHKSYGIHNASAMLVDSRTMEVKALIGSRDYFDPSISGQVNGTKAKRSPGSTLKPFIYALALDQGLIHPYTVLKDAPASFGDYNPENFDRDFLGPIRAKDALILSRNIPAIHLAEQLKNPTLYQFLKQARITRLKPEAEYGLSIVLGSAEVTMEELAALYGMLANQGIWHPLITHGQSLKEGIRLLSPEASFLTLDMLRETPRPYAENAAMRNTLPVYWKTGTSSGYRDAWSVGIFGPYVLAVWIGDFENKSNPSFIGATTAAPLFFNLIDAVTQQAGNLSNLVTCSPELNITKVDVCEASGLMPTPCCPRTASTWFIPGKSPIKRDTVHREIAIDSTSGLRTCRIDEKTRFVVYEFWPSDLLKIFAQAGIQRTPPPPFDPACSPVGNVEGDPPQIIYPQQGITYTLRLNKLNPPLHFFANADADVHTLYWFVNNQFLGSTARDQPHPWQPKPGVYKVRVVDNFGRTNIRELVVKTVD